MVSQHWSGNTKMRKWKGIESYQDARLINGVMELFVDNGSVAADTFEDMLSKLQQILTRIRE